MDTMFPFADEDRFVCLNPCTVPDNATPFETSTRMDTCIHDWCEATMQFLGEANIAQGTIEDVLKNLKSSVYDTVVHTDSLGRILASLYDAISSPRAHVPEWERDIALLRICVVDRYLCATTAQSSMLSVLYETRRN